MLSSFHKKQLSLSPPIGFANDLEASLRKMAWTTAVAMWLLEEEFGAQREEWRRIAVKAGKFLRQNGVDPKNVAEFF